MLTAAVIGAGIMGAGLEAEPALLSHSEVFSLHPQIKLIGLVDNDNRKVSEGIKRWNCFGYATLEELMEHSIPDIISICVPDIEHECYLEKILQYKPKLIILEKPCTSHPNKTLKLIEQYNMACIPVLVNYPRRYLQVYHALKDYCSKEKVISATIRYGKGLKHNGCHAIDLARLLFGEVLDWKVLAARTDYREDDPSVSTFMVFERCQQFFLQALNERQYTFFELDIFTEKGRVIIDNDHQRLRKFEVLSNIGLPKGNRLVEEECLKIDHSESLRNLVNNAVAVLENQQMPIYVMHEALKSEQVAYAISEHGTIRENAN